MNTNSCLDYTRTAILDLVQIPYCVLITETEMSAEIVIPPSPNWYTSDAFDCHKESGILAYAASRNLVIIWPNEQVSLAKTRVISDAHRIKVTCNTNFFYS